MGILKYLNIQTLETFANIIYAHFKMLFKKSLILHLYIKKKSFGPFRYYNECHIEDENVIALRKIL